MHRRRDGLFIDTSLIDIRSECHEIPSTEGIEGGVICTGFIDVEKIIRRVTCHGGVTHYFLEKKLPFQVVLIAFEKDDDHSGSESSGSGSGSHAAYTGGDSSGSDGSGSYGEGSYGSSSSGSEASDSATER